MRTQLADPYKNTATGREADTILRSCVHCGFCTATCPTYQLLGDELDSPRGRIYLIKEALEGRPVTIKTQQHLDRCLNCRACETTCPSGVRYGRLLDIGRAVVETKVRRPLWQQFIHLALRMILPFPQRVRTLVAAGHRLKPLLPENLARKLPPRRAVTRPWPTRQLQRKMLVFGGCVQAAVTPATNAAAARVLDLLGTTLIEPPGAGCCGAISHHLHAHDEARSFMKRNIDAWWPHIDAGAEAIITTASGCGAMIREYGYWLRDDAGYSAKAARISAMTADLSDILAREGPGPFGRRAPPTPVAFHSPCTLQHGQRITGLVEQLLTDIGYTLTPVRDPHLCCGSAGTYSILQPRLSRQLLDRKLNALLQGKPEIIATANIGCQLHLAAASPVPVKHWIELFDDALT